MSELKYPRILLKLSGEQFRGNREHGIDPEFVGWLAEEVKKVTALGTQVVIVVGGGNLVRGESFAKNGIERATADYMGMMATIMNGMALTDMLEQAGQPTRLMTRLHVESVAEPYIRRKGLRHLEKGRVVVVAGGTGNPYVTTDTASLLAASELECDAVLKATKVDGVYNKDPETNDNAVKFDTLTLKEALENPEVRVMDKSAMAMAIEQDLPIVVFDLMSEGNVAKVVAGETVGTIVS